VGGRRRVAFFAWSFSRINDRQRGGDDRHFLQCAEFVGGDEHATEPGVKGKPGNLTTRIREPVRRSPTSRFHRSEFFEQRNPITDLSGVREVDEWKRLNITKPHGRHLQNDRRQIGALNLGFGKPRSTFEVGLVVQPDADPRGDAATAPGALIR
jgi:hypothetical protein